MTTSLIVIAIVLLLLWFVAKFVLSGPDHSQFDSPVGQQFSAHPEDTQATEQFMTKIKAVRQQIVSNRSLKKGLAIGREFADNLSSELQTDCEFRVIDANGVTCEWAIAPGVTSDRRVLFLHGGAFALGSPKGHRIFAHELSLRANAAVLSVDYRMLPEHRRIAASLDAQTAYQWILDNGPDGPSSVAWLLVAGDSAGGNLALMLSGWSKANAARKPNAVIGFSPSLDTTLTAPSFTKNLATDPILGEGIGLLKRAPQWIANWVGLVLMRNNPANKIISPLFGELDELAPTLIQASNSEVLVGDAIRYTNKAQAAGSNVSLQLWPEQIHDWQLFNRGHGSANQAWEEVSKFIQKH